jgi:hypothetical protein
MFWFLIYYNLEFRFPFDYGKTTSKSIVFELFDEDATLKADKDDLVGLLIASSLAVINFLT